MDDKLKRELSAAVERGPEDPAVKKLIGESAQARAYFNGLLAVDRALRGWPAPRAVSEKDSDAFVDAVLARLDEPVSDRDFDPFAVPFADEREAQKTPRQHSEQHAMSQSNDQDNDDDLEGLAALMRPSRTGSSASVPPPAVSVRPGPALADDAMDESSGIVDIKHLAAIAKRASVPPASVDEALKSRAEEKAEARDKSDDKKDEKKSESKAEKPAEKKSDDKKDAAEKKPEAKSEKKLQAVPATTAAPEASEKKGSNPVVWIGLVGIAAAAAFGVSQMNKSNTAGSVNAEAPQSAAPSSSASANSAPAAQPAATQSPAPTSAPVAPAEGTAAPAQQAPEANAPSPTTPTPTPPPVAESAQGAQPAQPAAAIGGAAGATSDQGAARRAGGSGGAAESEGPVAAAPRNVATREGTGESAPARPSTATGTSVSAGAGASRGSSGSTAASASATPTTTTATATPPAARTTTAAATTAPTTGAAPAGAAGRPMSVDELMRRATGADRAEEAQRVRTNEQAAAQASLPPQLTRSMVSGAMSPFNSQVRACAQGQTGTATAVLTVSGDGSVSNVVVSSPWGSGPNDCITNRLRTARFPAVQRPSSRVVYPFAVLAPQPGG